MHYCQPDIKVIAAYDVDKDFNARFSALYRRYNYLIYQRKTASALLLGHSTWLPYTLDIDAMNQACQYLLGEWDFSAFRSSQCQSQSTHRNIHHAFLSEIVTILFLISKLMLFYIIWSEYTRHLNRSGNR